MEEVTTQKTLELDPTPVQGQDKLVGLATLPREAIWAMISCQPCLENIMSFRATSRGVLQDLVHYAQV